MIALREIMNVRRQWTWYPELGFGTNDAKLSGSVTT
jgi:hypothetical protein